MESRPDTGNTGKRPTGTAEVPAAVPPRRTVDLGPASAVVQPDRAEAPATAAAMRMEPAGPRTGFRPEEGQSDRSMVPPRQSRPGLRRGG